MSSKFLNISTDNTLGGGSPSNEVVSSQKAIKEYVDSHSGGGASRNVGEIVKSTIPLTDAGLHLLDGSLISGGGAYDAFITYIAGLVSTYPDLFETEANWQTAVSTYGVCGKFVYDSGNGTVRLPKITGIIEGTTNTTALGDLVEAGLPNITGTIFPVRSTGNDNTGSGAFASGASHSGEMSTVNTGTSYSISFDASRSSQIYGNSSTVQPQTIKVLVYIVLANSTKTEIEVDIDEVMTDLNGKADIDLSNTTVPHITETGHSGTEWYRVWSDGWCEQGGHVNKGSTLAHGQSWEETVTLTKAYTGTDYSIFLTYSYGTSSTSQAGQEFSTKSKTASSFVASLYNRNSSTAMPNTISFDWTAKGYIS